MWKGSSAGIRDTTCGARLPSWGTPTPPPPPAPVPPCAGEQGQDGVRAEALPAWLTAPAVGGTLRGEQLLLVFVKIAGAWNVVLGWPGLRVTHFGSFEMAFHLGRLQQRGGEVALFTEGLRLRGWGCCGQRGWPSLWQRGAWAMMRSHYVWRLNPSLSLSCLSLRPPPPPFLGAFTKTLLGPLGGSVS